MSGHGGPSYDRYHQDGRAEWLMRLGPAEGPPILFAPPLFEELNRTRALLAATMRGLAAEGFACWLPDLPGTGESERDLGDCGWDDWTGAVAMLAGQIGPDLVTVAVRGGALLDDVPARAHWRLSPVAGTSLARDLARADLVGGGGGAGYQPRLDLIDALRAAAPADIAPLRTVRLTGDPRPGDAKLDGPALWRRSEPAGAPDLAAALAADIAHWTRSCVAC